LPTRRASAACGSIKMSLALVATPFTLIGGRAPPAMMAAEAKPPPVKYGWDVRMAQWKPGTIAPDHLDGSLPGDFGMDYYYLAALARPTSLLSGPWSFEARKELLESMPPAEVKANLAWMRESEIKHGRLAMLAVVGWPLSELLNPWVLEDTDGRAPSLLNGGLDEVVPFLTLALAFGSYVEVSSADAINKTWLQEPAEYIEGDLGFDPLRLYAEEGAYRQWQLRLAEVCNGRLAMLAITGFAIQEFLWRTPVVDQMPWAMLFGPMAMLRAAGH